MVEERETQQDMKTNLAALMTYWFCATDPNLLNRVTSKEDGIEALERIGIPRRYLRARAVATVEKNKDFFKEFYSLLYCPTPRCYRRTQRKFYRLVSELFRALE